jgi:hypothetical protein
VYQLCTPAQRRRARTLLLVGARLDSVWSDSTPTSSLGLGASAAAATAYLKHQTLLPARLDEMWILALGWRRRSERGGGAAGGEAVVRAPEAASAPDQVTSLACLAFIVLVVAYLLAGVAPGLMAYGE